MTTTLMAAFPSPPQGVWHLGWLPIRAYALFIIVGIIAALVIGDRRWVARGGEPGVIYDIALWAVPFGLIGGRLYHVMTDWKTYFGSDGLGFFAALRIWDGGLGIWGAVALGAIGAWIGCRQRGIPLPAFGDAIAPGIVLAQAIGRLGNYFNQELFGRETTLPWGLKIFERRDASGAIDYLNGVSTGHVEKIVQPTFLYELLWNVLVFVVLIFLDRWLKMGHGRLFATYVALYCVGRFGVELLRSDHASLIAGIRINSFTSTFVFIGAVVYITLAPKGREDPATLGGKPEEPKEAKPKAEKVKAAELKTPVGTEDSELMEWTKELAAVAVPSGVVAGVAVAAAEDEAEAAEPEETPEAEDADVVAADESEPEAETDEPEVEESADAEEADEPEADEPEAEESEDAQDEAEAETEESEESAAEDADEGEPEEAATDETAGDESAEDESEPEAETDEPEAGEADEAADDVAVEDEAEVEVEADEPEGAESEETDDVEETEEVDDADEADDESEGEAVTDEAEAKESEDAEDEAEIGDGEESAAEEADEGKPEEAATDEAEESDEGESEPASDAGTAASPTTPVGRGRPWRLPRFRGRQR